MLQLLQHYLARRAQLPLLQHQVAHAPLHHALLQVLQHHLSRALLFLQHQLARAVLPQRDRDNLCLAAALCSSRGPAASGRHRR